MNLRALIFGGLVAAVAATCTVVGLTELHGSRARADRAVSGGTTTLASVESGPRIVFRHTGLDSQYGVVAAVPLAHPGGPRAFTGVSCDRVDAGSSGASCLRTVRGVVTTYRLDELDPRWHTSTTVAVQGLPSRTRLSPDGSLVATTVFVNGDSYLVTGFSTRTQIRRVGGAGVANLEQFALTIAGRRVEPVDRNLWGVTFADDRTFYATLATGGRTYLVKGDLTARTLTTVADTVECPSISPDGTRIAFKQKGDHAGLGTWWTPAVLDLATGRRTVLNAETHNVDDQIEWLDDDTLLYGLPREGHAAVTDVWSLDTTPGATPGLLIKDAWSPAVIR